MSTASSTISSRNLPCGLNFVYEPRDLSGKTSYKVSLVGLNKAPEKCRRNQDLSGEGERFETRGVPQLVKLVQACSQGLAGIGRADAGILIGRVENSLFISIERPTFLGRQKNGFQSKRQCSRWPVQRPAPCHRLYHRHPKPARARQRRLLEAAKP